MLIYNYKNNKPGVKFGCPCTFINKPNYFTLVFYFDENTFTMHRVRFSTLILFKVLGNVKGFFFSPPKNMLIFFKCLKSKYLEVISV